MSRERRLKLVEFLPKLVHRTGARIKEVLQQPHLDRQARDAFFNKWNRVDDLRITRKNFFLYGLSNMVRANVPQLSRTVCCVYDTRGAFRFCTSIVLAAGLS
jgi:hypothetical protein